MTEERAEHQMDDLFRRTQAVVLEGQHDCSEGDCLGCPWNMFDTTPRTDNGDGCVLEYLQLAKL